MPSRDRDRDRTQVRRKPERAAYDLDTVAALDAFIEHIVPGRGPLTPEG